MIRIASPGERMIPRRLPGPRMTRITVPCAA